MSIAIMTDSNSGITQAQAKELGITVVPMPFYINEDVYYEDITMTQEEFYLAHGTRHRAALGITEETDAIALVVSEETGAISYAYKGKMYHNVSEAKLTEFLKRKLLEQKTLQQHEKEKEEVHDHDPL